MNLFVRYRTTLVVIALIIAAFLAYSFFFAGKEEAVLSQSGEAENAVVENELIALLLELKALKLDDSIFSSSAFQSLQDFSQALVSEPVGRSNPFAPLGSDQ